MNQKAPLTDVPEITAQDLRDRLERGEALTVLDVRRAADWSEWTVPGSLNSNGLAGVAGVQVTPGARVITVCGRGNSSRRAAHELIARGVDAVSLKGGMRGWSLAWNSAEVPGVQGPVTIVQVRRTGKGCLSYVVCSRDEAAVVDASVDPEVYRTIARSKGAKIVAVLDTHVHADHLSRGRDVAKAEGAALYMPEQDRVTFPVKHLGDEARVEIGDAAITALRTPGHTFESTCYSAGGAVMTGDTLFLDSVGRPDLKSGTDEETRERARLLHRSLKRLAALRDDTIVLPGHTSRPVAFDGQALSARLDQVRRTAARYLTLGEAAFVEQVTAHIPEPPANHLEIVRLNETGDVPADASELEAGANRCAVG